MANPLDGVRAKIERAEQHLFNFEVGAAHFERGAYTTRIERDHTAGGIRLFAEATRPLAEPPAPLMLLAGEIAYQLRSALDHIAFLLAKDTPEGRREFPVFDTSNSYISEGARKIKGMSARATAIVESVQPYRRGESAEDAHEDTLWMLHRINITDKHQLIPGSLVIANNIRVYITRGKRVEVHLVIMQGGKHDTELAFIPLSDLNVDVKTETICAVAFAQIADTQDEPVVPFLSRAVCCVKNIAERFSEEF